jgi:hypothetical protein
MKLFNIKLFTGFIAILLFTSCLKKNDMNIDPDETTGSFVQLAFIENGSGTTINSGFQYFSGGALILDPSLDEDTLNYTVNLGGASAASKDIPVTVALKKSAILDNYSSDSLKYELMPDSIYKILNTTTTIKAGARVAPFQIKMYPSKIDFSKNYMLPVEITDASGTTISSNYNIIYFHIIGNPMTGGYSATGYFYHPSSPRSFTNRARTLTAVNASTLTTELGDLGGSGYFADISVDDPFNTTSVQKVTITVHTGSIDPVYAWPTGLPTDNPGYTAAWTGSSMCNNTYDPVTKTFYLRYGYLGANGYRVTEEWIKKN